MNCSKGKFLTVLTLFLSFYCFSATGIGVTGLRCDEKTNPTGVSRKDISFSWLWDSGLEKDRQQSYRIVVASDPDKLNSGDYDVWDSGRIKSAANVHVGYKGKELTGNKKYFWKAMVWNREGKPSAWSKPATFVTALGNEAEWQGAEWIGYEEMPRNERVVPGIHTLENHEGVRIEKDAVVPYLRKSFNAGKAVREAFLSISGLGHYEAYVNGQKISDFLAPGWTHYDRQVLFNTYEVTDLIGQGENVIAAVVGNGFHYINHKRYLKLGIAFGYPKLICRLKITYTDGSEDNIVSDTSWKATPSPVIFSSIYGGEDYDANMEKAGWNNVGYDDSSWPDAVKVSAPAGKLEPETTYPLAVTARFSPKKIYTINDSCYTWDFGQNASGIIEVRLKGRKGDKIRIWPGELLSADTIVNQQASGGPYYFEYTLKGEGEEVWRPKFTYYGFRYATVEGASPAGMRKNDEAIPEVLNIEMLHTGNSALRTGSFECSSELMNRTFKLIDWAIRSNMQSVVTDCPHREKLGWAEVVHLMGNSIRYNYSLYHLYRKIIRDMVLSQRENGLIPDIAPEYVVFSGGFVDSPEWGSASVIVPWLVYKWYGDRNILEEAYPMMSKYVGYLESKSENHILSHGLGDWFDYGPEAPGVAQLTPVSLTATAIYYYDVRLLSEIATVLGKKHDAELYTAWANKIKNAFNDKFYDPVNKTYSTSSQTAIAMPLCVGLVDDADKEAVYTSLCRSIEKGGYALTAGDVGFHFLVSALSQNQPSSEVLYKMVNRSDVPGYGYQLAKGATALTESWPALEVVSNNHMMLGHIMEWFYTCLLGINDATDAVASDKIVLRPMPVGDITWAKGSYLSPRGPIDVDWKKQEDKFTLKCSIPDGLEARIVVPQGYTVIGKTHPAVSLENIESADGNVSVKVMGGKYEMSFSRK